MGTGLDELEAALDRLRLEGDGDELARAFRLVDRLVAAVTRRAGELDADGEWVLDGATSLVAWLRDRDRMSPGDAVRTARAARRLRKCAGDRSGVGARAVVDGAGPGGRGQHRRSPFRALDRPRS